MVHIRCKGDHSSIKAMASKTLNITTNMLNHLFFEWSWCTINALSVLCFVSLFHMHLLVLSPEKVTSIKYLLKEGNSSYAITEKEKD
jgi:hypothetical protein